MAIQGDGYLQLGANAVDTGDQYRLFHLPEFGPKQASEPTNPS